MGHGPRRAKAGVRAEVGGALLGDQLRLQGVQLHEAGLLKDLKDGSPAGGGGGGVGKVRGWEGGKVRGWEGEGVGMCG